MLEMELLSVGIQVFFVDAKEYFDFSDWHKRFIYPLQTFIGIATDHWSSVHSIEFYTIQHTLAGHPNIPKPLKIYFITYKREYKNPNVRSLFTLEQIKGDFEGIMERWLDVSERYAAPCELFFAVLLNPSMYLQHQFLNLAQAAEAFHRIRSDKKNTHFRTRVTELLDEVQDLVNFATGYRRKGDPSEFVDSIVATRNFYTHHNESGRGYAVHGSKLDTLTESLKILIHATLIRELQLPDHLEKEIFRNSGQFDSFRQRQWFQ